MRWPSRSKFSCLLLSLLALISRVRSFQAIYTPSSSLLMTSLTTTRQRARRMTSSDAGDDAEPKKRKRRKRKVAPPPPAAVEEDDPPASAAVETTSEPILQPRGDREGVSMRVQNIMSSPPSTTTTTTNEPRATKPTYIPSGESEVQDLVSNYAKNDADDGDDPLARMLRDARAMENGANDDATGESGSSLTAKVQNVISTIVTVDFFVVCALLVWFLVGIGASAVAKDDTIQIAFNNIFEPVVQPALGVLMIASISDAVLKPKEDDEIKL